MDPTSDNPYDALKRTFHEPKRLAIVSALCAEPNGLTFTELRALGDLTDGNLSRHLKTLEGDGVVVLHKAFVGVKPQTTVLLTSVGRDQFMAYLLALEEVLKRAESAMDDTGTANAGSPAPAAKRSGGIAWPGKSAPA